MSRISFFRVRLLISVTSLGTKSDGEAWERMREAGGSSGPRGWRGWGTPEPVLGVGEPL